VAAFFALARKKIEPDVIDTLWTSHKGRTITASPYAAGPSDEGALLH